MKTHLPIIALVLLVSCSTPPKPAPSTETPRCLTVKVDRYFDGERAISEGPTWIEMDTEKVRSFSKKPSTDCSQVDLSNLVVLPGLVDGHTHVFLTDRTFGRDFSPELERHARTSLNTRRAEAVEYLQSILRSGFTSIRDLGNSGQYLDVELRDSPLAVNFPRIYGSGPGIATGTAQFPSSTPPALVSQEYKIVRSIGDVDKAIKDLHSKGVSLVKVYADNEPQQGLMSQDLLDAAVKFAHQRNLKITAHASQDASARRAIRAGVDSIEHGVGLQSETLASMSERRVLLVATDFGSRTCQSIARNNSENPPENCGSRRADDSRRLVSARDQGVDLAFGSDMYLALDGELNGRGPASVDSLVSYVEAGLSAKEAILSATAGARKLLGDDKIGVLRDGSYPDLVAYDGDPLRSIEAVRKPKIVIKGGRIVCGIGAPRACH